MADTNGSTKLPNWFLAVCGTVLATGLPWGAWVTYSLIALQVSTTSFGKSLEKIETNTERITVGVEEVKRDVAVLKARTP